MGAFFLLRINDHMQYLRKIKDTLEGTGDFRGGDHHACKLGVWMDTTGAREAAEAGPEATVTFNALHDPHERFHSASGRALRTLAEGRPEEAELEVTEMHRLSSALVNRLLELDGLAAGKG